MTTEAEIGFGASEAAIRAAGREIILSLVADGLRRVKENYQLGKSYAERFPQYAQLFGPQGARAIGVNARQNVEKILRTSGWHRITEEEAVNLIEVQDRERRQQMVAEPEVDPGQTYQTSAINGEEASGV